MTNAQYMANDNHYRVNTFDSQANANYKAAIQYYQAKFKALFNILSNETKNKLFLNSPDDLETLVENCAKNFLPDWEALYNSKQVSYETMRKTVLELQDEIIKTNEGTAAKIDYYTFITTLAKNSGVSTPTGFAASKDQMPQFLDLEGLQRIWAKIEKGENTSIPNLMGEIFEQGVTGILQNSLSEIFAYVQQTGSAYARGKKVKPDAILSITDFTIEDAAIQNGKKITKNNEISTEGSKFAFELQDLIDLNSTSQEELTNILHSAYPGLVGMTAKQWTTEASYKSIAKFKIPDRGPFTKAELEGFQDSTLRAYNVWAISRYLISILGSLNVVIASGSQIETTHGFLQSTLAKNRAIIMQKRADLLKGSGSLNIGPRGVGNHKLTE